MIRRAFRIRHHIATASAFAWVSLMTSPAWASGSSMPVSYTHLTLPTKA